MTALAASVSRRSLLAGGMTLGMSHLAARRIAAEPVTVSTPTGWDYRAGQGDALAVAWNSFFWDVFSEPTPDRDGIWLISTDIDEGSPSDEYLIEASHIRLPWTTLEEIRANELNYRFPTRKPLVIEAWATGDASGFATLGGPPDDFTFNYLELSALEQEGMWRSVSFAIPAAIGDGDRALELYRAVTVDDRSVPRAIGLESVIDVLVQHASRER